MPTYTYACSQCDHRFDAVQSIHDAALSECVECGGPVRRVISAVGVSFKGSGFYRTDSRASGSKDSAGTKSGSSDKSTPKPTTSTPSSGASSAGASPA